MFRFAGSFYNSKFFLLLPDFFRLYIYRSRFLKFLPKKIISELNSLSEGEVILDLGANTGVWSDIFSLKGFEVISVEPDPGCIEFLRTRFGKNNQITLLEKAVSTSEEPIELLFHKIRNGVSDLEYSQSSSISQNKMDVKESGFFVETVTLSHLIKTYKPTFVKMDIEGAELEVLKQFLNQHDDKHFCPYFAIEKHSRSMLNYEKEMDDVLEMISKLNLTESFSFDWK